MLRLLLLLIAKNNWEIDQMDVIATFLNLEFDHEIYIWLFLGLEENPNPVYLLNKILYGMK